MEKQTINFLLLNYVNCISIELRSINIDLRSTVLISGPMF